MPAAPQVVIDGLVFGEGPRWHDDSLWFSDMHDHAIHRVTLTGGDPVDQVVARPEDVPSGLGWLADGTLVFVGMETQRLYTADGDGLVAEHADCSGLARGSLNDMIVRSDGTAFVGDMGYHIFDDHSGHSGPGQTIRVTPAGVASMAADDLGAPNGHVLTPDEKTLYVAESSRGRVTAFAVGDDGSLSDQRVFAELPAAEGLPIAPPDGICLDAEGAIWAADPIGHRLIRARAGGTVTDVIDFGTSVPVAVVLGGPDRRTLFACVADDWKREAVLAQRRGRIEAVGVDVPGAGKP